MAEGGLQKKRAPSLWLIYDDDHCGDILMVDVCVPARGLAKCTYYCCLNWNSGQEGGGYCGIQDHPDGRAFIFSLWDSQKVKDTPVQPEVTGAGTNTEPFDGEGHGLKSMNFELGWKEDQWYTVVVRRWEPVEGKSTLFGCWVCDQSAGTWSHLMTMRYPVEEVFFTGPTVSFLEDWNNTSENYRCVKYKDGFKRKVDTKSLVPFRKVIFQVNMNDVKNNTATENYDVKYDDHKPDDAAVCLEAGGNLQCATGSRCIFNVHTCDMSKKLQPITIQSVYITEKTLAWALKENSIPQFRYSVLDEEQEGRVLHTAIDGSDSIRQLNVVEKGKGLVLEVEDILGHCSSKKVDM